MLINKEIYNKCSNLDYNTVSKEKEEIHHTYHNSIDSIYFKSLNLIYEFIVSDIIPNYPFVKCHVKRNTDPCEFYDWKFYLENEENYSFKDLIPFYDEIINKIGYFSKDNNCLEVFDRILFLV